jgi:hypothetical protein
VPHRSQNSASTRQRNSNAWLDSDRHSRVNVNSETDRSFVGTSEQRRISRKYRKKFEKQRRAIEGSPWEDALDTIFC